MLDRLQYSTLAVAACVAMLVAGCGGGGDAGPLLHDAFTRPVHSANVDVELAATLNGGPRGGPFDLKLAGPYRSNGSHEIPSFQWALTVVGGHTTFTGGVTSTGDDLYLTAAGTSYDLGAARVAQTNAQLQQGASPATFGISPRRWVRDASVVGTARVGGVETTHVRAGVDLAGMLSDLDRTVGAAGGALPGALPRALTPRQIAAAKSAIRDPALDVYVAKRDGTLRRFAISFAFQIPPAQRAQFRGVHDGSVTLSVELSAVGQPVSVRVPPNVQPFSAAPTAPQANPSKLRAYSQCLARSAADPAAVQRCSALLR